MNRPVGHPAVLANATLEALVTIMANTHWNQPQFLAQQAVTKIMAVALAITMGLGWLSFKNSQQPPLAH